MQVLKSNVANLHEYVLRLLNEINPDTFNDVRLELEKHSTIDKLVLLVKFKVEILISLQ